jgi:hypothetical protein
MVNSSFGNIAFVLIHPSPLKSWLWSDNTRTCRISRFPFYLVQFPWRQAETVDSSPQSKDTDYNLFQATAKLFTKSNIVTPVVHF